MQTQIEAGGSAVSFRGKVAGFWADVPRWQTAVSGMLVAGLARTGLPPEALGRIEYASARALGQPLSRHAWPRMTFNDKVTYRRLRSRDARLTDFTDKLRMREYAIERLGEDCVPKVLQVADNSQALADLVGPFALKANHGSGWVILVEERRRLTPEELATAQTWLETDYGAISREWAYLSARRLLYVEELLTPVPPDYKFFVFDGKSEAVLVAMDRFIDHRIAILRPDWTPVGGLSYRPGPAGIPPQPPNLQQMLSWATVLAADLDFVRVDLYDLGDRVLVGELTPYPTGGLLSFRPAELDKWLGRRWTSLPQG